MIANRIAAIQQALDTADLDGWFFSCFQRNDPVSLELLGLPENQLVTRRCYYLVPCHGEPRKLTHALEPEMLGHLPGSETRYLTWRDHGRALGELVTGCRRLAAQYSPQNELPAISRLDAGTAEFLEEQGVELISSAELVQQFAAVWTEDQLAGHQRACSGLHQIVLAAFEEVGKTLRAGREIDEYAVQKFILESFEREKLWTDSDPIVGANAHSADPHYQPGPGRSSPIRHDDFLLIDLWAKEKKPSSVYADITWCGVCAPAPAERHQETFSIVKAAREAGLAFIQQRYPQETVRGFEVDDVTRQVIDAAGYGESFIHRTGHSLGIQDHGNGANLDNLETHDTRPLFPMTGFSIEPGIYLPGEFGVRSEINVVLTPDRAEVTGGEPQAELLRLLP
jgi:Xaa-Pro dipeptidase